MGSRASTPLLRTLSRAVGWLADRRIPTTLRPPVYRLWAWATKSDLSEVLLPLDAFPSLGAFFIRHLQPDARPIDSSPDGLSSPVDGTVQSVDVVDRGTILQAKGRPYSVEELLDGRAGVDELEGGTALTIYLAPYNYHRIHSPADASLEEVHWVEGARYSVHPRVLSAREKVLSVNERVVLRLATARGPLFLVLVGALNVGRIRVVGVEPGAPAPEGPLQFERGAELARFEMGSTIVLLAPPGVRLRFDEVRPDSAVRMGECVGRFGSE